VHELQLRQYAAPRIRQVFSILSVPAWLELGSLVCLPTATTCHGQPTPACRTRRRTLRCRSATCRTPTASSFPASYIEPRISTHCMYVHAVDHSYVHTYINTHTCCMYVESASHSRQARSLAVSEDWKRNTKSDHHIQALILQLPIKPAPVQTQSYCLQCAHG
jgi:hypothetical protein